MSQAAERIRPRDRDAILQSLAAGVVPRRGQQHIQVGRADEIRALLRDVMSFLLRAQWTESSCYACKRPELVQGGFSEHLASTSIRIDYVQHAMAALSNGARVLELN